MQNGGEEKLEKAYLDWTIRLITDILSLRSTDNFHIKDLEDPKTIFLLAILVNFQVL